MYIECKAGGLVGDARIGRVTFSKAGKSIYYNGMTFKTLKGTGFKSNYVDEESGEEYWISGPRKTVKIDCTAKDSQLKLTRMFERNTGPLSETSRKTKRRQESDRALISHTPSALMNIRIYYEDTDCGGVGY